MSNFDEEPTDPDGTNLPFDMDVELVVDDTTPASRLASERRCPRCEKGVEGRGLIRITDRAPQPTREEALRLDNCVATVTEPARGGWSWCGTQLFITGLLSVYWGPERRDPMRRLPPPDGVDRRKTPTDV